LALKEKRVSPTMEQHGANFGIVKEPYWPRRDLHIEMRELYANSH
jgi:hypothetical protein